MASIRGRNDAPRPSVPSPRSAAEMIVPHPIGRRAFRRDLPADRATDGGESSAPARQQQSGHFELVSSQ
jgi:hypothetical protein